jgi:hypothetical protein
MRRGRRPTIESNAGSIIATLDAEEEEERRHAELSSELCAYLAGRIFGAERTTATAPWLNQLGHRWCREHGLTKEAVITHMVAASVTCVLAPSCLEVALQKRMLNRNFWLEVRKHNTLMQGSRPKKLGWMVETSWWFHRHTFGLLGALPAGWESILPQK